MMAAPMAPPTEAPTGDAVPDDAVLRTVAEHPLEHACEMGTSGPL